MPDPVGTHARFHIFKCDNRKISRLLENASISGISMLKSENFLVRISKFPLRGYKTRQDTELPLKSQIFRSRLENTSTQRNRVQTQHRNAHPRLSKNSKTSSASLLKARNPSYFSVRKLQNISRKTHTGWVGVFDPDILTLLSSAFSRLIK